MTGSLDPATEVTPDVDLIPREFYELAPVLGDADWPGFGPPLGSDDLWTAWEVDELVYIQVGRVYEDGSVLPHNNATSRVVGTAWVSGAVQTQ